MTGAESLIIGINVGTDVLMCSIMIRIILLLLAIETVAAVRGIYGLLAWMTGSAVSIVVGLYSIFVGHVVSFWEVPVVGLSIADTCQNVGALTFLVGLWLFVDRSVVT